MRTAFALAAFGAVALAQGVTETIAPEAPAPAGFSPDYSGQFQITTVNITSGPAKRQASSCGTEGSLTLTLAGGVLKDGLGRTGYIAANYQFQFDAPAQTGAIYTGGFSIGQNQSLALGGSAVFYACLSGTFNNLYDRAWAPQCSPVLIQAISCGTVPQQSDGQPQVTTIVTQLSDGQPQATSVITQISDGQPQAPTSAPVTQISDGQPQAPTSAPVTQISDGQPQAPTSVSPPPVTQISDGQPQAPTSVPTLITQISDGQPQAPTSAPTLVTQIPDGQPQAPSSVAPITNATATTTAPPVEFTGAATNLAVYSSFIVAMAGLVATMLF